jgi:HlyD family secretion protein
MAVCTAAYRVEYFIFYCQRACLPEKVIGHGIRKSGAVMKHKLRIASMVILASIFLASGCQAVQPAKTDSVLNASGTLAADDVKIASEIGGLIKRIHVKEGDEVQQGQLLFAVDDALFLAEKTRAEKGLAAAEAALKTAEEQARNAEYQYLLVYQQAGSAERAFGEQTWMIRTHEKIDLPVWYFQKEEQLNIYEEGVLSAEERLMSQKSKLAQELTSENNQDFLEVEETLHAKQVEFETALHTLEKAKQAAESDYLLDAAQEAYDAVLASLESAQKAYERELTTQAAEDILEARAKVAAAKSDLDFARDKLDALRTGDNSLQVKIAESGLSLAESGITQAQAMVDEAKAALGVLNVQEGKLSTISPVNGVVLSMNTREGEIVGPGSTLMTIASLEELQLTVYISEDNYGQVNLGQEVEIRVDSFPEELFFGEVTQIADQAEFTPRNVQTVEGRKTTVYAVKIRIENLAGKLKPGMPADVSFE